MEIPTGHQLKTIRVRLGLTTRDVAAMSKRIASSEGRKDFELSHARLVQIESGRSAPSVYKIYSLSAIYGVNPAKVLGLYVGLDAVGKHHFGLVNQATHVVDADTGDAPEEIGLRMATASSLCPDRTTLLSDLVASWGDIPASVCARLNPRRGPYGVIGRSDLTMYPLLRPGSLVQIEGRQRVIPPRSYVSEYERPLYFIEHRSGYICSWCERRSNRLMSIPHPLSPCNIREFEASDAQILGRVTALALRLVPPGAGQEAAEPDRCTLAEPLTVANADTKREAGDGERSLWIDE